MTSLSEIEERVVKLEERVKTLFSNTNDFKKSLDKIEENQVQLLQQVSTLNSVLNTLKWALTIFIAMFGTIFGYLLWELIKIVH